MTAGRHAAEIGAAAAAPGMLEPLQDTTGCGYVGLVDGPARVSFMVLEGLVARVDVRNPDVRTARGAAIGDPERRIRELYSDGLEVRPHKYVTGNYLIARGRVRASTGWSSKTEGERVTGYRAGVLPAVEWVEGCS